MNNEAFPAALRASVEEARSRLGEVDETIADLRSKIAADSEPETLARLDLLQCFPVERVLLHDMQRNSERMLELFERGAAPE